MADDAEEEGPAMGDDAMGDDEEDADEDDEKMVTKAMEEAQAAVDKMSFEELLAAPWPNFHGTGFFPFVARLNHSCSPNVQITFPQNSSRLTAVALENVAPGQELCICYVRKEDPVDVRRRGLVEYGFTCQCKRCVAEDTGAARKTKKRLK